jgi:predicted DNA-binding transcriptional regulator AlpA
MRTDPRYLALGLITNLSGRADIGGHRMLSKDKISNDLVVGTTASQQSDLALPITSLKVPSRATNALTRDGVHVVAQLVQRTEADLLGTPNFGRLSLAQVKQALARRKLRLGMALPETPPVPPSRASADQTLLFDYLTPRQVAAELGICEKTLARWHAARRAPPRVTVGRRLLYRRTSVSRWIEQQEKDR